MLRNVWKNRNDLRGIDLGDSKFYSDGWGQERTNDRYNRFQEAIRQLAEKTNCYPIEYDYINW